MIGSPARIHLSALEEGRGRVIAFAEDLNLLPGLLARGEPSLPERRGPRTLGAVKVRRPDRVTPFGGRVRGVSGLLLGRHSVRLSVLLQCGAALPLVSDPESGQHQRRADAEAKQAPRLRSDRHRTARLGLETVSRLRAMQVPDPKARTVGGKRKAGSGAAARPEGSPALVEAVDDSG